MATALITGASAGLGAAFAKVLAATHDLVLVARDERRLDALAASLPCEVEVLPADLATDKGCDAVAERLAGPVDVLVNNAGRSLNTSFVRSTVESEEALLRLNVHAVMRLTLAALPGMVER